MENLKILVRPPIKKYIDYQLKRYERNFNFNFNLRYYNGAEYQNSLDARK